MSLCLTLQVVENCNWGRPRNEAATAQVHILSCLNQPWFQLVVKQNVKAQDLKAGTAAIVVGEAGTIVVLQNWVCSY